MASFVCNDCGHKKNVPDTFVGRKAKCPKCGQSSSVLSDDVPPSVTKDETYPWDQDSVVANPERESATFATQQHAEATPSRPPVSLPPAIPRETRAFESDDILTKNNGLRSSANQSSYYPLILVALSAIIAILLVFLIMSIVWRPTWQYKTIEIFAEDAPSAISTNQKEFSFKTIPALESKLQQLGSEGWEIVSSFLEMETSHPNFGKEDLVTGIQPNIRPQKLVIILKKPK